MRPIRPKSVLRLGAWTLGVLFGGSLVGGTTSARAEPDAERRIGGEAEGRDPARRTSTR